MNTVPMSQMKDLLSLANIKVKEDEIKTVGEEPQKV